MIEAVVKLVAGQAGYLILVCLIFALAGWLLSVSLAFRLHFANDTIRMLRANAFSITPEESQAMERAVVAMNGGQHVDSDTPLAGDAATLRGLLERLK